MGKGHRGNGLRAAEPQLRTRDGTAETIRDLTAHPWAGVRALGEDRTASLPLFKEVVGAIDEKKAAAKAAQIYERVAEEFAAQEAVLDQLQEHRHG